MTPWSLTPRRTSSGTSFGLYFAYEEYCSDDSNSPAEQNVSPPEITGMVDSVCGKLFNQQPTVARGRDSFEIK